VVALPNLDMGLWVTYRWAVKTISLPKRNLLHGINLRRFTIMKILDSHTTIVIWPSEIFQTYDTSKI
jgi:hypothetical protein